MANAVEMLREDHQRVRDLFERFEGEQDPKGKGAQEAAAQIFGELLVHAQVEEEVFYPAVQDAEPKAVEIINQSLDEHHAAESLIDELMSSRSITDEYQSKMVTLISNVRHHIEEEERRLLPMAEKALGDKLEDVGEQMSSIKKEAQQAA